MRRPPGRRRAERLVGVQRVGAGGDEIPGHATRRQVIAGALVPRGVRAGTERGPPKVMAVALLFAPEIGRTPFRVPRKMAMLRVLDLLIPEPGVFYIMDRDYVDFDSSACSRYTEQGVSSSSAPSPIPKGLDNFRICNRMLRLCYARKKTGISGVHAFRKPNSD